MFLNLILRQRNCVLKLTLFKLIKYDKNMIFSFETNTKNKAKNI